MRSAEERQRRAVKKYVCPVCLRAKGVMCADARGKELLVPHKDRLTLAGAPAEVQDDGEAGANF